MVGGKSVGPAAGGTTPATWATTAFCVHTCAARPRRGPRPPVCPAPPTLCGLQYKPRPHRVGVLRGAEWGSLDRCLPATWAKGGRALRACRPSGARGRDAAALPGPSSWPRGCSWAAWGAPPAPWTIRVTVQYAPRVTATPGRGAVPRRRGVERGPGLYRGLCARRGGEFVPARRAPTPPYPQPFSWMLTSLVTGHFSGTLAFRL